jgi:hypothetical protein
MLTMIYTVIITFLCLKSTSTISDKFLLGHILCAMFFMTADAFLIVYFIIT